MLSSRNTARMWPGTARNNFFFTRRFASSTAKEAVIFRNGPTGSRCPKSCWLVRSPFHRFFRPSLNPDAPWCWNIYLHLPPKWLSYVGKYSSTMEHLGNVIKFNWDEGIDPCFECMINHCKLAVVVNGARASDPVLKGCKSSVTWGFGARRSSSPEGMCVKLESGRAKLYSITIVVKTLACTNK